MNGKCLRLIGMCAALASAVALADWEVGDNTVMTVPQLPTIPGGWDVMVDSEPKAQMLADDWRASTSGRVTDAHLWLSWNGDNDDWSRVSQIDLAIYQDVGNAPAATASWKGSFALGQFMQRLWPIGTAEGDLPNSSDWFDPWGLAVPAVQHGDIYQVNINDLGNAIGGSGGYFTQVYGNDYWLSVAIQVARRPESADPALGWHTSTNTFDTFPAGDAGAVYWETSGQFPNGHWRTVDVNGDRLGGEVNLAFVMTPEPGGLALLLAGGAWLSAGRRRRRTAPAC